MQMSGGAGDLIAIVHKPLEGPCSQQSSTQGSFSDWVLILTPKNGWSCAEMTCFPSNMWWIWEMEDDQAVLVRNTDSFIALTR